MPRVLLSEVELFERKKTGMRAGLDEDGSTDWRHQQRLAFSGRSAGPSPQQAKAKCLLLESGKKLGQQAMCSNFER
ncbi:hypothetical protein [Paraburkholderia ferrariae]|uniref:hypothetical protein n=1 Tax=Paraburkholderia ferrariae TaxID=386056 RepID=UPI0012EB0D60|nr:hypothetical protein [Paraburkholderia ferrariae]